MPKVTTSLLQEVQIERSQSQDFSVQIVHQARSILRNLLCRQTVDAGSQTRHRHFPLRAHDDHRSKRRPFVAARLPLCRQSVIGLVDKPDHLLHVHVGMGLTPRYIFRGHATPIHSISCDATDLMLGDEAGYVSVWSRKTCRPWAVWQAHESAVMKVGRWKGGDIITHGRDNTLVFWQMGEQREYDTRLPVEGDHARPKPWITRLLPVNATNFCPYAMCAEANGATALLAVPHTMSSEAVDIYSLPLLQRRVTALVSGLQTGMVMTMDFPVHDKLVAGYESGHVVIFHASQDGQWMMARSVKEHTQPVLSVACCLPLTFSSSADARILCIPLEGDVITTNTHHAGQTSLSIHGGLILTAGWDGRGRVYDQQSMLQVAVLKFHKGSFAATFSPDGSIYLAGKDGKATMWALGPQTLMT